MERWNKKVYVNGPGHMAATPIYGKNIKNLPWNQKSNDLALRIHAHTIYSNISRQ